jgi:hypothetical protein
MFQHTSMWLNGILNVQSNIYVYTIKTKLNDHKNGVLQQHHLYAINRYKLHLLFDTRGYMYKVFFLL